MSEEEEVLGRAYDSRLMRRLLGYVRPYRGQTAVAAVFVLLESVVQLAGPYLTKEAIDNGIRHRDLAHLDLVAVLYLTMLAVGLGVGYLNNQIIQRVGQHVMLDLRMALFRQLQRLPVSFYDRTPVGRLMTRVTHDVDALNELATAGIMAIFGDLFTVVGIVFAMWRLNVRTVFFLGLMVLCLALLPVVVYERAATGFGSGLNAISAGRIDGLWLPLLPEVVKNPLFGSGHLSILWSHAMRADGPTTPSPSRPETGTKCRGVTPSWAR